MRRLPPLNSLRAFEATGRLGNMSAAAKELFVTHGAVSKQIRLLEAWLDIRLFERRAGGPVLTRKGASYFDAVSRSLDAIAEASLRLGTRPDARTLRITAPPAFTARWLVPRLPSFGEWSQDIDLHLNTSQESLQVCLRTADVVIRRGPPDWLGVTAGLFLEEHITPVCHPRLMPGRSGQRLAWLRSATWLHTDARSEDWQTWLAAAGLGEARPAHSLHFDHSSLTIDAALRGMGVAMVPLAMVQEDLRSGALVVPFRDCVVQTPGYFAICSIERVVDPRIASFCNWLRHEGLRTGHDLGPPTAGRVA